MKRPSFQFYPSDWLRDTALRSCSTGARGLWMDMICFMHEGKPYGHLKVGDKVILPSNLARMVGDSQEVVADWLLELSQAGVFETDEEGVIYSKRMIRDENLRQIRAAGGIKGGNPVLKDKGKVNLEVKQKPTPSSSSSSSSSSKNNILKESSFCPSNVSMEVWKEFVAHRKLKKATVTQLVIDGIVKEANKAGWPIEDALKEVIIRNWKSFKAEWVAAKQNPADVVRQTVPSKQERDPELVRLEEERKLAVKPNPEMMAKLKQFTNGMKI